MATPRTIAAITLALAGCTTDPPAPTEQPPALLPAVLVPPAFVEAQSCEDNERFFRKILTEVMERDLTRELQDSLGMFRGKMINTTIGGFGGTPIPGLETFRRSDSEIGVHPIDEERFATRDDDFLYVASAGGLRIFALPPGAPPAEVGHLALKDRPAGLLRYGRHLLLVTNTTRPSMAPQAPQTQKGVYYRIDACSVGYNCRLGHSNTALSFLLVDVHDATAPSIVRSTTLPGGSFQGHLAGSTAHIAVTRANGGLPWETWPEDLPRASERDRVIRAFDRLREENRQKILDTDLADLLPWFEDTSGQIRPICGKFFSLSPPQTLDRTTLLSIDLTSKAEENMLSLVGGGRAQFTDSSLVLVQSNKTLGSGCMPRFALEDDFYATLLRFSLDKDPSRTTLQAAGVVPGYWAGAPGLRDDDDGLGLLSVLPDQDFYLSVLRPAGTHLRPAWASRVGPHVSAAQLLPEGAIVSRWGALEEVEFSASKGLAAVTRANGSPGLRELIPLGKRHLIALQEEEEGIRISLLDARTLQALPDSSQLVPGKDRGEMAWFPRGERVVVAVATRTSEACETPGETAERVAIFEATTAGGLVSRGTIESKVCGGSGTSVQKMQLSQDTLVLFARNRLILRPVAQAEAPPLILDLSP